MIDLHAHVLPGIDDGPADDATSLALLDAAEADGVTRIAATPHLRTDHPGVVPDEIADRCAALAQLLPRGSAIELVPAAEVDVLWAQHAADEQLVAASYGGRGTDLLVETPYGALPSNFEEMLFAIAVRGFRLLLAHPERSATLQDDPRRLGAMIDRGVLTQVTAAALLNPNRRSASRRFAEAMIRERRAHVLASDAHRPDGPRRPSLAAGRRLVGQSDPHMARWLVEDAPAAIIAGDSLPAMPRSRSAFGFLRRRRI